MKCWICNGPATSILTASNGKFEKNLWFCCEHKEASEEEIEREMEVLGITEYSIDTHELAKPGQ